MNEFKLTDTVFRIGQWFEIPVVYHDMWVLENRNIEVLDSVVIFLNKHPKLYIEVGCHTDQRPIPMTNDTLSKRKALSIMDYLISKGVASSRISYKGFADRQPRVLYRDMVRDGFKFLKGTILTKEYISSLKTIKEKEAAQCLNRRDILKITKIK